MRVLRSMAALLAAVPFVVAALLAGCTRTDGARTEAAGAVHGSEETHLSLEDGKRLAAERGVPVLVDFWSPT